MPHGHAVALGMLIACIVSERVSGLDSEVRIKLVKLLQQYQLPVSHSINTAKIMDILKMDKKRNENDIDYIVLNQIGEGAIKTISFEVIQQALETFAHASNN